MKYKLLALLVPMIVIADLQAGKSTDSRDKIHRIADFSTLIKRAAPHGIEYISPKSAEIMSRNLLSEYAGKDFSINQVVREFRGAHDNLPSDVKERNDLRDALISILFADAQDDDNDSEDDNRYETVCAPDQDK